MTRETKGDGPETTGIDQEIVDLQEAVRCQCIDTSLGLFWVYRVPAEMGRNPRTGELLPIPERAAVGFLPSADLLEAAAT